MKIIGKTNVGFIIEASEDDVANLIGYYSHYTENFRSIHIGQEINVHAMFQYLYNLGDARHKLKAASDQLHSLAEAVNLVAPLIPEKPKPETAGEGVSQ